MTNYILHGVNLSAGQAEKFIKRVEITKLFQLDCQNQTLMDNSKYL